MKKFAVLLLLLAMLPVLCACGEPDSVDPDQIITRATDDTIPSQTTEGTEDTAPTEDQSAAPVFVYAGVELIPGTVFDPAALPEADSMYSAPSCAIQGTDNLYSYGAFELTAFDDGTTETIYSVYLMDPAVATAEGLKVSDPVSSITALYGENYSLEGAAYVYTYGDMLLSIVTQNDAVLSIEYRQILPGA